MQNHAPRMRSTATFFSQVGGTTATGTLARVRRSSDAKTARCNVLERTRGVRGPYVRKRDMHLCLPTRKRDPSRPRVSLSRSRFLKPQVAFPGCLSRRSCKLQAFDAAFGNHDLKAR